MQVLPYEQLLRELDISKVRELEDLIIDSIYKGLLKGKVGMFHRAPSVHGTVTTQKSASSAVQMDQKNRNLEVHDVIGRDVLPQQIAHMKSQIQEWCASPTSTPNLRSAAQHASPRPPTPTPF